MWEEPAAPQNRRSTCCRPAWRPWARRKDKGKGKADAALDRATDAVKQADSQNRPRTNDTGVRLQKKLLERKLRTASEEIDERLKKEGHPHRWCSKSFSFRRGQFTSPAKLPAQETLDEQGYKSEPFNTTR